jgi:tetratricopeptide (TPR) repeat protein
MKNYKGALEDYNKSIEIFPEFADAYYNRSLLKRTTGDDYGAMQDFAMAQEISQDNYENPVSDEKFQKLVELDAHFNADFYNKDYLQNQMANIDIEPKFSISFLYGEDTRNSTYFSASLNDYNNTFNKDTEFILQNNEKKLEPDEIYTLISVLNKNIESDSNNGHFYFNRAVFRGRIEDYNGAIEDYNRAIELNPKFSLAYFNRANIRVDLIELIESFDNLGGSDELLTENDNYKLVLADYNKCIQLDPTFSFAFYNRANFKLRMKQFEEALEDFNKTIELNDRLPQPYFNRGLLYLYLEDRKPGCQDIGKAGEMGIKKSYNIIKRFCN